MIKKEEVVHVAKLARLELTPAEAETMQKQLSSILNYIDQLKTLDVSNVEPLVHAAELSNVFRDDTPRPSLSAEDVLRNAPHHDERFFKVPRIIEES